MGVIYSLLLIVVLILPAALGSGVFGLQNLLGVTVPYAAFIIFLAGLIYRVVDWARSPVPFCIPTVCGQQKSLPWIKADNRESPYTTWGVVWRMALEILFFRSLFRNDRAELKQGQRLLFTGSRLLWLAGLVFHWSLLVILVRHLRLFIEPLPACLIFLQNIDTPFQTSLPALYMTDLFILLALVSLFFRRLTNPQVRYISLPADYFALFLILGIVVSGVLMRHFYKTDLVEIKGLVMGLAAFKPVVPKGAGSIFFVHLFLVSALFAYFPFSKLMHMGGVFLSPTRNMKNNNRMERHINPWNYPVKVHTYAEWEDEFRDAMKDVGLPVEREAEGEKLRG